VVAGRRYFGNVEKAARLFAARQAAGFDTARKAAQRFGWKETRYRAHESAARDIADADTLKYCFAFGISQKWLDTGEYDSGSPNPMHERALEDHWKERARRLYAIWRREDPKGVPENSSARRLRIARRLAGYGSVTKAARALGFVHSSLSTVERGVHALTERSAQTYAAAFGCELDWLLEGKLPSGYPPHVEKLLPSLLHDYSLPESEAAERLPLDFISKQKPGFSASRPRRSQPASDPNSPYERVPQYDVLALSRSFESLPDLSRESPTLHWPVPAGYLRTIFDADPKHTIVVPAPPDLEGFVPGDRLFVDTSLRLSSADIYVTLERKGPRLVVYDGRRFDQRRLLEHPPRNVAILGRLVAVFGHARLSRV
jgi:hypothetical protein